MLYFERSQTMCTVYNLPSMSRSTGVPLPRKRLANSTCSNTIGKRKRRGEGVQVTYRYAEQKLNLPGTVEDLAAHYIIQLLMTADRATEFPKGSVLNNRQIIARIQNTYVGTLHALLSHPIDVMQLLPNLDKEAFPPAYNRIFKNQNLWSEQEKERQLKGAKKYYRANPKSLTRMRRNEARLIMALRTMLSVNCYVGHQYYQDGPQGKFRLLFSMKTLCGQSRILSLCLACSDAAVVLHNRKEEYGILFDSFELITLFLE